MAEKRTKSPKLTPMLEQYFEIKRQVPDAILFYRLGDFYEMFFEDAEKAAPILDLVLTARGKGGDWEAPMCGVPYHAADQHIAKLIRHGLRVAVCDQVEEASQAKGIVRREVVRIVTPGTAIEGSILDRDSCYLLALSAGAEDVGGACLDVSTGDFFVSRYAGFDDPRLRDDVARFTPREIIASRDDEAKARNVAEVTRLPLTVVDESWTDDAMAYRHLVEHFHTDSLRGFGLEQGDARVAAAAAALRYAAENHKRSMTHVASIRIERDRGILLLDSSTIENLEIFESRDSKGAKGSLWGVINGTKTAMGGRMLRQWLSRPLCDRDAIFDRHDAVDELTRRRSELDSISTVLSTIADLERLISRISLRSASPREALTMASSLESVAALQSTVRELRGPLLSGIADRLDPLTSVIELVRKSLSDDPPQTLREGGVIRSGVHPELDELRTISRDAKSILMKIEAEQRERTGIASLKVRFNNVFGYYIEVSKANLSRVPDDYIRKQTLTNAERFITPELKTIEEKILGAEERAAKIEAALYDEFLALVAEHADAVLRTARAAGETDALASLAQLALRNRYVRPEISDLAEIRIDDGRHPVIETMPGTRFIPNSTSIVRDENGIQIITGPNMGGKSTYLRQVALIVLLNQIGSFVPASRATLGLFDRIFTRVGASDNLARGESTFMVEMHETANILNNATQRSLIVLDEVGRGTATFDGLSLAWAIIEYLHDDDERSAITLFATHYHEVTDLAKTRERVANYSVSVREWNDQIIFLRKVVRGAADKSYGIQVAKLAGIPQSVIARAREVLATLERKERDVVEETRASAAAAGPAATRQIPLFGGGDDEIVRELRDLELETLAPLEALNLLDRWKRKLTE